VSLGDSFVQALSAIVQDRYVLDILNADTGFRVWKWRILSVPYPVLAITTKRLWGPALHTSCFNCVIKTASRRLCQDGNVPTTGRSALMPKPGRSIASPASFQVQKVYSQFRYLSCPMISTSIKMRRCIQPPICKICAASSQVYSQASQTDTIDHIQSPLYRSLQLRHSILQALILVPQ
jgi:hypothetical protein